MITGDARNVADAVAAELGIDEVFAEVLPEHKDRAVHRAAGAAATASPWSVTASTTHPPSLRPMWASPSAPAPTSPSSRPESSSPRATRGRPRRRSRLSRASYRKMLQNLGWATGYNVVAIPLAAGVLAFAGHHPLPGDRRVLMSLSTIVVAANAQLLRRVDLTPEPLPA